jgi:EmrB/QacA subfamily drug resistance transporter
MDVNPSQRAADVSTITEQRDPATERRGTLAPPPPRADQPAADAGGQAETHAGVLVALGLAALVAVLDGTVVSVALGTLVTDLHAPLTTVAWTTVGYLLAAATMLPLLGWLTARFGGRAVLLTGMVLFGLGSALSALAWSAGSLIGFRVVQGLGGGMLEPTSLMLVARLTPRDRVGRVMGRMSMIINVAPAVGPIVGGALLGTGHWQWIFIVNIPLILGLLGLALAFLPDDRPGRGANQPGANQPAADHGQAKPPSADARGLVLLTTGYVGVLLAVSRSGQDSARALTIAAAVLGAALLGGYAWHALTTRAAPAFDLRLLRRQGFATALAVMSCVGFIMYSQLTALPVFSTQKHHLHGAAAGLLVCALGLGLAVSMSWGGRMSDRTGPRPLVRAGAVLTAAGLVAFAVAHDRLPFAALFVLFVVIGLGFGATASPTFSSIFRLLPPSEQSQGTTALFMSVQLSASLGVTVLGLLQSRTGDDWLTWLFGLLAATAVLMLALSGRLPGRPEPA